MQLSERDSGLRLAELVAMFSLAMDLGLGQPMERGFVNAAATFYQILPEELLVVCDDFNLPLGKLRLRSEGSAGGQKGLDDIIKRLGTDEFSRLRFGIGPVPNSWDPADFVLGRFSPAERAVVEDTIQTAADAVECWVSEGIEVSMNRFN